MTHEPGISSFARKESFSANLASFLLGPGFFLFEGSGVVVACRKMRKENAKSNCAMVVSGAIGWRHPRVVLEATSVS